MSATTSRTLFALVAGVLAGAVGFYAGILALLLVTGLDSPGWAPVAQVGGAALFSSAAISLVVGLTRRHTAGFVAAATVAGLFVGAIIMTADMDFETAIGASLVLVAVTAATARTMSTAPSTPAVEREAGTHSGAR